LPSGLKNGTYMLLLSSGNSHFIRAPFMLMR
jgi:hypothetical protein